MHVTDGSSWPIEFIYNLCMVIIYQENEIYINLAHCPKPLSDLRKKFKKTNSILLCDIFTKGGMLSFPVKDRVTDLRVGELPSAITLPLLRFPPLWVKPMMKEYESSIERAWVPQGSLKKSSKYWKNWVNSFCLFY